MVEHFPTLPLGFAPRISLPVLLRLGLNCATVLSALKAMLLPIFLPFPSPSGSPLCDCLVSNRTPVHITQLCDACQRRVYHSDNKCAGSGRHHGSISLRKCTRPKVSPAIIVSLSACLHVVMSLFFVSGALKCVCLRGSFSKNLLAFTCL